MKGNQATHSAGVMCRVLKISRSGYYAWLHRPMSARARQDLWLTGKVEAIHRRSRGAYGSPMIHAELADEHGIRIGRKRVARLMRAAGLRGAMLRRFVITTTPDPKASRAIDLVDRPFYAEGPDRLWVADITYIPTWAGFLYLAMVLDVYSRRIVGWAMEMHLKTELILAALEMALAQRRPQAVIHHSDRGCQYTSYAFGKRCQEAGVMPSMGSVGDAYDNAMAESFFATLERELLGRRRFKSQAEAKMAVFEWIEGWYNPHRRHSARGYRSPVKYEQAHRSSEGRESNAVQTGIGNRREHNREGVSLGAEPRDPALFAWVRNGRLVTGTQSVLRPAGVAGKDKGSQSWSTSKAQALRPQVSEPELLPPAAGDSPAV